KDPIVEDPPPGDGVTPPKKRGRPRKPRETDEPETHDPTTGEIPDTPMVPPPDGIGRPLTREEAATYGIGPGLDIIDMAWQAAGHGTEFFNHSFVDMRSMEERKKLAEHFLKGSEARAELNRALAEADKRLIERRETGETDDR